MTVVPVRMPFTGRETEMGVVLDRFDVSLRHQPVGVVVTGESGIGKSRLVQEALTAMRLKAPQLIVLEGAAVDIAHKPSFWPVTQAIQRLGRIGQLPSDASLLWEQFLKIRAEGDRKEDIALSIPSGIFGADLRSIGLELLSMTISSICEQAPLVLVIEDLQWADRSTVDLMTWLMANLRAERLMLLATVRDEAVPRDHPLRSLITELRRHHRFAFVDLQSLSKKSVSAMIATEVDLHSELGDLIWERSGGNPFWVEECLQASKIDGDGSVPMSLRQLVLGRLHGLTAVSRDIAMAMSIGEEPVDHWLLALAVGVDEADLLAGIREAVEAGILEVQTGEDGYRFRCRLYKEVISEELLPGEQARLHQSFARALETKGGAAQGDFRVCTSLAYHYEHCGDRAGAMRANVAAARQAESVYGWTEALNHWSAALRISQLWLRDDSCEPLTLLLERTALSAHLAGEPSVSVELLEQMESLISRDDRHERATLSRRLGSAYMSAGDTAKALEVLEAAVAEALIHDDSQALNTVLGSYAISLLHVGRFKDACAQAERALEVAKSAGSLADEASMMLTLGFGLACTTHGEQGIDKIEQSKRLALEHGQPEEVARALFWHVELLAGPLNQLPEAVRLAREGIQQLSELGLKRAYGASLHSAAANALFRLGRWNEADVELDAAMACAPTGACAIEVHLSRARLLVGRGQLEEAERELETIEMLSAGAHAPRYTAPLSTLRAGLLLWRDDPRSALSEVLTALGTATAEVTNESWIIAPLVWHGLRAVADWVESRDMSSGALVVSGPKEVVDNLLQRVHRLQEEHMKSSEEMAVSAQGYLLLCEAEARRCLSEPDETSWSAAASWWEQHSHPYPAAYAQFRQAESLYSTRTRSAKGAEVLRRAAKTAKALEAWPFLSMIEALAVRARVPLFDQDKSISDTLASGVTTPANTNQSLPSSKLSVEKLDGSASSSLRFLTKREKLVLSEIAVGLSNREIGERLFISEKTVSAHVSNILSKLGVRSRVQASAIWHRSNR